MNQKVSLQSDKDLAFFMSQYLKSSIMTLASPGLDIIEIEAKLYDSAQSWAGGSNISFLNFDQDMRVLIIEIKLFEFCQT